MPAYRWLYVAMRGEILAGHLRPGTRLPATRDLARQYALSRGTIVSAFDQLASEGYVTGTMGSGTYVSRTLPDDLLQVGREPVARPPVLRTARRYLSDYGRRVTPFPGLELRPPRAFRANLPALDAFPAAAWARIMARRSRQWPLSLLMGCEPIGYAPLRAVLAHYLGMSRGVQCTPDQVVIVSGVQEALDLVARLFLNPRDRVCMENPGYPGAAIAFESVGARVSFVPLDDQGMLVPAQVLRGARLVYVTPGHQFPLGMTMSLPRRLQLLDWARKTGGLIFEDDYDSEYRYSGRPVPALHGLDRTGQVFFAGSFSKVLFPSLRLGYLVVPPDVVDRFAAAKSSTSRHAPLLDQAVLQEFIAEGHFGRHLRRMRELYAERLAALLASGRQYLTGLLEISPIEAGLQTVGWLRGIDAETAAAAAAERNVETIPLGRYYRGGPGREGLVLGFAAVSTQAIRRGVRDLAAAVEQRAARRPLTKKV
ncbi:MAG TPA: PLP-dependent aminotransferase family protein [bacterium]|nr:PLP-dependent aminotransferase family protein [bacterium]